jgi:hypothetical protein
MSKKLLAILVAGMGVMPAAAQANAPGLVPHRNDCGVVCRPSDPPKPTPKPHRQKPPRRPHGGLGHLD